MIKDTQDEDTDSTATAAAVEKIPPPPPKTREAKVLIGLNHAANLLDLRHTKLANAIAAGELTATAVEHNGDRNVYVVTAADLRKYRDQEARRMHKRGTSRGVAWAIALSQRDI